MNQSFTRASQQACHLREAAKRNGGGGWTSGEARARGGRTAAPIAAKPHTHDEQRNAARTQRC